MHLRLASVRLFAAAVLVAIIAPAAPWTQSASAQTIPFDPRVVYDRAAGSIAVVRATINGRSGVGTGFALAHDGLVLTAAHVARRADAIFAEFPQGGQQARLVGYDARRDVAVLRLNGGSFNGGAPRAGLEVVAPGDVRIGEPVVVIGAPRGRPGVMTTGSVLATQTSLPGLVPDILIRVSAPVAPGSSGSPVLNARGEVIGLVIAISGRPGAEGALAVSSSAILDALPRLTSGARVERAWIGISGRMVTPGDAREFGVAVDEGALIQQVLPDSPAERAGLRPGDVIVAYDARRVRDWEDLLHAVGFGEPGQTVRLTIARGQGRFQLDLVLGTRP